MRKVIRPLALRDLNIIKKLTGLNDIRYEDIVYVKRLVREVILSRDPQNIQMLKCFTLENTLQGLCILLKKIVHTPLTKIDTKDFIVSTVVINQKTGEQISETVGMFDFDKVSVKDAITLFHV